MKKFVLLALLIPLLAGCAAVASPPPGSYKVTLIEPVAMRDGSFTGGVMTEQAQAAFDVTAVSPMGQSFLSPPDLSCADVIARGGMPPSPVPGAEYMQERYNEQCGLAWWVKNAAPADSSTFRDDFPLESLPSAVLAGLFAVQKGTACNPRRSIAECAVFRKDMKMTRDHGFLKVAYGKHEQSIKPAAFGDIDHDGRDDLLLMLRVYTPSGTDRSFHFACATRTQRDASIIPDCVFRSLSQ